MQDWNRYASQQCVKVSRGFDDAITYHHERRWQACKSSIRCWTSRSINHRLVCFLMLWLTVCAHHQIMWFGLHYQWLLLNMLYHLLLQKADRGIWIVVVDQSGGVKEHDDWVQVKQWWIRVTLVLLLVFSLSCKYPFWSYGSLLPSWPCCF